MPAGERPGALLSAKGRRPSHERTPISRYGGPAEDPVASRDLQTKQDNENKLIEDKEGELTANDGMSRVLRGGSFNDRAGNLRSVSRSSLRPSARGRYVSFRTARTLP